MANGDITFVIAFDEPNLRSMKRAAKRAARALKKLKREIDRLGNNTKVKRA